MYHGINDDLFIALFRASVRSLATYSSIPRILAKSDADVFSRDLTVKRTIAKKIATDKTDEIVNATTDNNSRYEQASRFFTLEEYEVADANLKGVYGS
jgi:hypothetical protein